MLGYSTYKLVIVMKEVGNLQRVVLADGKELLAMGAPGMTPPNRENRRTNLRKNTELSRVRHCSAFERTVCIVRTNTIRSIGRKNRCW